jgi:hypothetical protein
MKEIKQKLSLDIPVTYHIKVPGHLNENWSEWTEKMAMTTEYDDSGLPITLFVGSIDQAALQGILRQLYSLGVALISAICVDCDR